MNVQLKFNYLNYGNTFVKNFKIEKDTVYIFSDFSIKNLFLKERGISLFENTSHFFTLEEFKGKIFTTSKFILKETKKILSLYKSIPQDIKTELEIENYYDIIDFADNFFKFFRDLNINLVSEIKDLEPWQKEYIDSFYKIKYAYEELLERYNYLPIDWLEQEKYLNLDILKKYKKVVFIDIPYFSPLDRKILADVSKQCTVEIFLQMDEKDFDEEKMTVKNIKLPERTGSIEVYKFSEPFEELINLLELLSARKGDIFSGEMGDNYYHRIAPKHFSRTSCPVLNDTEIYKFMEVQHTLLASKEPSIQAYPVDFFRSALSTRSFKNFYSIDSDDLIKFNEFICDDYKYISLKLLNQEKFADFSDRFRNILHDLEKIEKFKKIKDFTDYFNSIIRNDVFHEKDYTDFYERFSQALGNALSTEFLELHRDFADYFKGNISASIYKLILYYMDKLELKISSSNNLTFNMLKDVSFSKLNFFKKSYFIGINSSTMPHKVDNNSILTESQKELNGFQTKESKRLLQKYRFFQGVLNSPASAIFCRYSESLGIDSSPFVDELMLTYNLDFKELPVSFERSMKILDSLFFSEKIGFDSIENLPLPKDIKDFKDFKIKLGYYDYKLMKQCPFHFYLQKIAEIPSAEEKISIDINGRFIGRFIHDVMEQIAKDYWAGFIRSGITPLSDKTISEYLDKFFEMNQLKIPVHLNYYFSEVVIPHLKKNIKSLYEELAAIYSGYKIQKFQGEKSRYSEEPFFQENISVYLSGRADLVIETKDGSKCILDYKTGGGDTEQLDFYAINLYGDSEGTRGLLRNLWDPSKNDESEGKLTSELLKEDISWFLNQPSYEKSEKAAACSRCSFTYICRR